MIKHLNVLIGLCIVGLVLGVIATLLCVVKGLFLYMGIGAGVSLLLFAMLIVLLKERRVGRIMSEDDYDSYDGITF